MKYIMLSALLLAAPVVMAAPGQISINPSSKGPEINPNMYGIFLEEINHGVDGGLYGELIQNRGFEDARAPEGYTLKNGQWRDHDGNGARAGFDRFGYNKSDLPFWTLIQPESAKGSIHLEKSGGITEASAYCMRLEAQDTGKGTLRVVNEGFFGIGVETGKSYNLSLYVRGNDPLKVYLEDDQGQPCSDAVTVNQQSHGGWKKFTGKLTATRTEEKSRLAIAPMRTGKVWLDFVSLFPSDTWKERSNGLRPDLAQMVADLNPKFVRFPGGCIVGGGTIETAYNWKDTIGPVEKRKEQWGDWMCRMTHGMGVYEYLQFCQDLGAEPLWVGFDGQTCIFRDPELVPMKEMGWVRDNFMDFVQYCNGSPDSQWGRYRAAAGHPAPFDLKYIEIGNENQGEAYGERYRFVHDALKAKYPNITYLADLSFTGADTLGGNKAFDIEDNHFYSSPQWFSTGFHRYDGRDRNLPPVYLGEVAVTSGESSPLRGNMLAALSEGVFLMGCERNSDVIKMISYAPLLGHVEGRTELVDAPPPWHAMIYFDNLRAFGTVSYQLWKLFGNNRPDYTVKTDVTMPDNGPYKVSGSVGVGTWATSAEFKDVCVTKNGQTLYQSDFKKNDDGWKSDEGQWKCDDGAYRQDNVQNALTFVGDESWSDYTLTLKARKLSGNEGFLICFGRNGKDKYWWNLGGWGNTQYAIEMNQNLVGQGVPGKIETGRWYDIRIELNGDRIRCFLDGKLIHDVNAAPEQKFFATSGYDAATGEIVLKAINLDEKPVSMVMNLNEEGVVPHQTAKMTVLRGDSLQVNNSLDDPNRVAPKTVDLTVDGKQTAVEFPAYSLSVIRVKAAGK